MNKKVLYGLRIDKELKDRFFEALALLNANRPAYERKLNANDAINKMIARWIENTIELYGK